ncbi:TetR/AcrR family transcriptional regulator [uncultured Clostridium sp.]|uniref:TetR/AcrR family transcriptional regulator n=1 Tax=uncultured Clostridium sp. TaxID=59620 RepID=UPI0025FDCAA6|nr:TetR/AcrR family transcriptional regulator [uncultured Clostridium sp.]
MSIPDRSIDPRILSSAKKEFLTNGFEKTSLKTICDNAGITTGALYKRYKGKEDLFHALVADTVADLNDVLNEKGGVDVTALSDSRLIKAWDMDLEYMLWWFRFLYERHDGFVLLLRCSEGTAYAKFQHDWVEQMTVSTGKYLQEAQRRGLTGTAVSREELHVLLSAFWSTIYEPFIHDFSWEQIESHCKLVCRLFNWYEALAFDIRK